MARADEIEALRRLADEVRPGRDVFVGDLVALTELEIGDLKHDDGLRDLLRASIAENVDRLLATVLTGTEPPDDGPPPGAMSYARRLGHSPAPLAALLRAYRIGQARFTAHCLEAASRLHPPLAATEQVAMVNAIAGYIDEVCEAVTGAYQAEHERWLGGQDGRRRLWVNRILDEEPIDLAEAESGLGYRLSRSHLAAEIWIDRVRGSAPGELAPRSAALAAAVRLVALACGPPDAAPAARLAVPRDDTLVHCWFAWDGAAPEPPGRRLLDRLELDDGVRVTLGTVGAGLAGFRASHAQAVRTRELVSSLVEPRSAAWPQVAPVALLLGDREAARAFVDDTLGELARPDPRYAELRETLRVFVESRRSYAEAAERLHVHRNTVHYRVQRAEELCAHPDRGTFDLLAALTAAAWLTGPH